MVHCVHFVLFGCLFIELSAFLPLRDPIWGIRHEWIAKRCCSLLGQVQEFGSAAGEMQWGSCPEWPEHWGALGRVYTVGLGLEPWGGQGRSVLREETKRVGTETKNCVKVEGIFGIIWLKATFFRWEIDPEQGGSAPSSWGRELNERPGLLIPNLVLLLLPLWRRKQRGCVYVCVSICLWGLRKIHLGIKICVWAHSTS